MENIDEIIKAFYKEFGYMELDGWGGSEVAEWLNLILLKKDKENRKKLLKNIGMMRQWLNEDRITEINKMVNNQDLLMWIDLK